MIRYSCALIRNKMNFIPQVVKTEDNEAIESNKMLT
jgi:hypothetical protein